MYGNLDDVLARCKISLPEPEGPKYLIERNGAKALPINGFAAIMGGRKSGKSQAATVLMSAVLGEYMFGFTPLAKNRKILYIDTDHTQKDTMSLLSRLRSLVGPYVDFRECVCAYNVIGEDDEDILDVVEYLIKKEEPALVVIDQIDGLVPDYGDPDEGYDCIQRLSTLNETCCIMGVIFEYEEELHYFYPMRTIWRRKSRDVFTINKGTAQCGEVFSLSHVKSDGTTIGQLNWRIEDEKIKPFPIK